MSRKTIRIIAIAIATIFLITSLGILSAFFVLPQSTQPNRQSQSNSEATGSDATNAEAMKNIADKLKQKGITLDANGQLVDSNGNKPNKPDLLKILQDDNKTAPASDTDGVGSVYEKK